MVNRSRGVLRGGDSDHGVSFRASVYFSGAYSSGHVLGHASAHASGHGHDEAGDVDILEDVEQEVRDQLKHPPKYAVVLLNDDYTTMEFVVEILKRYFNKTDEEAAQVMLRVHQEGRGVAGVYGYDIAETKAYQVDQYAKAQGFPLKCVIEPLP